MDIEIKKKLPFQDDPLAQEVLREGLEIQDRFLAEPIYAKTGKGYLKSVGVAELAELKEREKRTTERK